MWDLIVLVPDHCFTLYKISYFDTKPKLNFLQKRRNKLRKCDIFMIHII